MMNLFPLRSIHIVDIAFQLMRKNPLRTLIIALTVTAPVQIIIWIFQVAVGDKSFEQQLSGRTIVIIVILQFFSIGWSLSITSNLLSGVVGKTYCQEIFQNIYTIQPSPRRFLITLYHGIIQIAFIAFLVGTRFLLGHIMIDSNANTLTILVLLVVGIIWTILTLRLSFAVPIYTHEGGTSKQIQTRRRQINHVHFFKLFGVYCYILLLVLILALAVIPGIHNLIANNFATSSASQWAFFNIAMTIAIAYMSAIYSYALTITYFDARIECEGFDIAVATEQLIQEENLQKGGIHGKLLDTIKR